MEEKLKLIKSHIAKLIRRKQYVVGHAPENPVNWRHDEVIDPRSGEAFTYPGAWDFIAEILEQRGTTIKEKTLDKPPKKRGFILKEFTKDGIIYIKVQFGGPEGNIVEGRSFHYDEGQ